MGALRYQDALDAYERATAIEAHPSLLFNRGRALQALHRYPEALDHFEEFRRVASPELLAQAGQLDELMQRLRAQTTTLELVCNVKGASVLVRGVKIGVTPFERPLRLNAGAAHVSVMADGTLPFERDLVLPGGGSQRIDVRLQPRLGPARITVRSPIRGAVVFVDGHRLGTAPAEAKLGRGRHRVRLVHPDFEAAQTTIEVADGENRQLTLDLERKPGLLQKWWFWTGTGAVVAGGVALTIALTTERTADSGNIPPGVVSAPLTRF